MDVEMYHAETNTPARANTSNLAEELGQVRIPQPLLRELYSHGASGVAIAAVSLIRSSTFSATRRVPLRQTRCSSCAVPSWARPTAKTSRRLKTIMRRRRTTSRSPPKAKRPRNAPRYSFVAQSSGGCPIWRLITICLHSQAYIFKDPELKQDVHDTASDPALFFRILGLCHTVLVEQQQLGEEDTVPERKDDEDERGTFRLSFQMSTER